MHPRFREIYLGDIFANSDTHRLRVVPFPSVASSVRSLSLLACWAHEPIQVLYVYSRVLTATERSTILYSPAMAGVAI